MSIISRSKEESVADFLSGFINSIAFYIMIFHSYFTSIFSVLIYMVTAVAIFQGINHYFGNLLIFLMKGIKGLSIHIHTHDLYLSYLVFCLYLCKDLFSGAYLIVFSILFTGIENNQQFIFLIVLTVLVYLFYALYTIYLKDIKKYILDISAAHKK